MKADLVTLRNSIIADPEIITLLGSTEGEIGSLVVATKIIPKETDTKSKISIYIADSKPVNRKVETRIVQVDAHITLKEEGSKGTGLSIIEEIKSIFNSLKFGRGLNYNDTLLDQDTAPGWWKGSVIYQYNTAKI